MVCMCQFEGFRPIMFNYLETDNRNMVQRHDSGMKHSTDGMDFDLKVVFNVLHQVNNCSLYKEVFIETRHSKYAKDVFDYPLEG